MEIQLSDCLDQENILFQIDATNRDQALSLLVRRLEETKDGFKTEEAIEALKAREAVLPTVISPGVALPHARLEEIDKPLVGIATTRQGIIFDADKDPVHLILLVLTPKNDPSAYLRVLSMLSGALKDIDVPAFLQTATADDVSNLFDARAAQQERFLTAADVMNSEPLTLLESDTLDTAVTVLCSQQALDVPVVDEEGDLRGMIGMEDFLRQSLPEHLLWMQDLSPILRFEPFADMIKKDHETKLADFMREDVVTVSADTPAVQLAKIFLQQKVRQIQVVRDRRLLGVVNLTGFATKLFWA
jgi:nitrogen PTS system EIIA component